MQGQTVAAGQIGLPTAGARVTSARMIEPHAARGLATPAYCQVRGAIDPVDRSAPEIRFALDLPIAWNHKALMMGGGGFDGVIPDTSGPMLAEPFDHVVPPLLRGYAVFASDSGHQAVAGAAPIPAVDAAFALNDEALANFGGAALKKTRDVATYLIRRNYGRAPERTYFAGGSNGGREGLLVAQRWPDDFDGVVVAFPFWNAGTTALTFGAVMNGFAAPGAYLPPAGQALLFNAVMARCDDLDGLKDGLISNVEACDFDPSVLKCAGPAKDTCLTDPQIKALRRYDAKISYPYRTKGRETSYPGFPVFAGADMRGDQQMASTPPVHPALATMPTIAHFWDQFARFAIARDPGFNPLTLDPQHPGEHAERINQVVDLLDADSVNLAPFKARGGKLILYHGLADPIVSPRSTVSYWSRLQAAMGPEAIRGFARFYIIPGYGHGPAGLGAFNPAWDALTELESWSEEGVSPGPQTITDVGPLTRSRPLCEYGTWPRYLGQGDPTVASSFVCAEGD
ncbi:MAG: tannase/feruloyl esterase family alpha/beta hydrolase [Phenylobacterium sp.]|uniref:tannase/feruloyl esterase family alpha/beta hydrolase n=1 Tax=Phenylobacterium sp. TaxID=1871053 RepID=UPI0025D92AF0|nr:tannase/feruloyl esterase family alpha/beta hydrolase [Phenylobacterium sp.]MBT9471953.1 tannase/feruloyl esterase family alpha/beta hydrolase [Phenylobacterium sp.]